MSDRIWVVSELYYPEQSATGYFLTNIAEGLAPYFSVSAVCGQPNYSARGVHAPFLESHNGVTIHRCWSTTFDKDVLFGRILNLLTLTLSVFFKGLVKFRRGDKVVVVTNPPSLPFLVSVACTLKGAACILLIHDVYPDVLVAASMLKARSPFTRFLDWLNTRLYKGMQWIIVLGRDMQLLALRKFGRDQANISIIPNWGDVEEILPMPKEDARLIHEHHLSQKFVVQYSGNIGRTHGLESLIECATIMREEKEVHFLFIGAGAKKPWLERAADQLKLDNVTILPYQPREELRESLNSCDVAIISFVPGMSGVSVPSRMYNIMAVGKPIIAVADSDSELALVVREEEIGWVIQPERPGDIAVAIREAKNNPPVVREMGARARRVAEKKYSRSAVIEAYRTLLDGMQSYPLMEERKKQ